MRAAVLVWLLAWARVGVRAGYITVGMTEARQCNSSVVEWYGDDGPYHLLLTPTAFVWHGYNVWIDSIPNGTTSYNLSINQPAGMNFMVTVWGASGIEYAGTTDVLTVLPSPTKDETCFLSDEAVTDLYSFAFNISNQIGMPQQCSDMSISWPTSLQSPIPKERSLASGDGAVEDRTGEFSPDEDGFEVRSATILEHADDEGHANNVTSSRRSLVPPRHVPLPPRARPMTPAMAARNNKTSSSPTSGNTTVPPTFFGIIPLGNSFSIPITYSASEPFAKDLPASSLSKTPTTWTVGGVTHTNWTINLAKGTRFILVAGIGSQEEWASGGSSTMMTVGQGAFGCLTGGDGPGITASETSTGPLQRPTAGAGSNKAHTSMVRTVIAVIVSVMGTLVLFALLWCLCSVRRKRRDAAARGQPKPSVMSVLLRRHDSGRWGSRKRDQADPYQDHNHNRDTHLDLMHDYSSDLDTPPSSTRRLGAAYNTTAASRNSQFSQYSLGSSRGRGSPTPSAYEVIYNDAPPYSARPNPPSMHRGSRTSMYDEPPFVYATSPLAMSPTSPRDRDPNARADDPLSPHSLHASSHYSPLSPSQHSPLSPHTHTSHPSPSTHTPSHSPLAPSPSRPYQPDILRGLDDPLYPPLRAPLPPTPLPPGAAPSPSPTSPPPARRGPLVLHTADTNTEDTDLKRETLALLSGPSAPGPSDPATTPAPPRRPRRLERQETSYLVHTDAGRVAAAPARGRVLELPPRYDEVNWDADEGSGARTSTPAPESSARVPVRAHTVDGETPPVEETPGVPDRKATV